MRIALCGTANQNITEFTNEFLKEYPNYRRAENKFNTILEEKKIKVLNDTSQNLILDSLISELIESKKDDNILYDYSLLDNLVYSMWLNTQGIITDQYINKSLTLVKSALHFYDLIFYFPNLPKTQEQPSKEALTEAKLNQETFYIETGNFYSVIHELYLKGNEKIFEFSAIDGCPAMIEIFGTTPERIQMTKLYLDKDGTPLGKKPSDTLITLPTLEEQVEIDKIRALNNK